MRLLLPLTLALAALAGCSLSVPDNPDPPPEVLMHDVRVRSYQGSRLASVGRARDVRYERDTGDFVAYRTSLRMLSADGGSDLVSDELHGNFNARQADGVGGVRLQGQGGIRGRTDRAHFDGVAETAAGRDPIHLEGPGYSLDAHDFSFRFREGRYAFAGGVDSRVDSGRVGHEGPGARDAGHTTKPARQAVQIQADGLDIFNQKNEAKWTGHVRVHRSTMRITCHELVAYYTADHDVTRILCDGNVEAIDGDKRVEGEHADFDNDTGVLVMTRDPWVEVWDGKTHLWGKKATFWTQENRIHVEQATTVIEKSFKGLPAAPGADGGTAHP